MCCNFWKLKIIITLKRRIINSSNGPFIAKMKKEFIIINPLQERKELLFTESGFA